MSWRLSEPAPGSAWLVLRSRNQGPLEQVARIEAISGVEMSWEDRSPPAGVLRYRIRRDITNPQYQTECGEGVWPRALAGRLALRQSGAGELELSVAEPGAVEVRIYDIQGRLVHRRSHIGGGTDMLHIDLKSELRALAAGVYFATARDQRDRTTPPLKLVVLE